MSALAFLQYNGRLLPKENTMTRTAILMATLFGMSSTAFAGFEVSSFKRDSRSHNLYNAGSALDSDFESCWMIDPEDKNTGQWIQMDLPSGTVDKVEIVAGWDKDENTFFDYNRIKKVRIDVYTMDGTTPKQVGEHTIDVEDKRGWQFLDFEDAKIGGEIFGGRVRMTILETYDGKDYPSLAVSEFRVHLKEFPADTLQISTQPDAADGMIGDKMLDGNARTFWAAPNGELPISFGVSAPGYGFGSLGITPGPKTHARPKTVEIISQNISIKHTMEDAVKMQWLLMPVIVGYTGSSWGSATVKIIDTYPADSGNGVAISEMKMTAATIEDL